MEETAAEMELRETVETTGPLGEGFKIVNWSLLLEDLLWHFSLESCLGNVLWVICGGLRRLVVSYFYVEFFSCKRRNKIGILC